jgi:hypothetical protein
MTAEKSSTSNSIINNLYYSRTTITLGTSGETKVIKAYSKGKVTCQVKEIRSRP